MEKVGLCSLVVGELSQQETLKPQILGRRAPVSLCVSFRGSSKLVDVRIVAPSLPSSSLAMCNRTGLAMNFLQQSAEDDSAGPAFLNPGHP